MSTILDAVMSFISNVISEYVLVRRPKLHATILALVVAGLGYVYFFTGNGNEEPLVTAPEATAVTLASVRSMVSGSSFGTVGTVEAVSEARLQTEAGGRVTGVSVKIGDSVRAGTVIASLESSSQRASLLQAQGSYEAAQAGAAQGTVGVNEAENGLVRAENGAVTTYKNAYTSVSGIVFGTIDQFFSNPDGQVPGVRLGSDYTSFLNSERVALQQTLPAWQSKTLSLTTASDLEAALSEAEGTTKRVLAMVDAYIDTLNTEKPNASYTEADYRALGTTFNGARTNLVGILASINAARTGLTDAREAINRAQIAGSGSTVSLSDAQVKIALGSLRAAQANYEKTLVRTPISGVVNALYLKTGDYATPSQPAAIIANNNGLEISTAVSQDDSLRLSVGDIVRIDGTATGTINAIAGAIDPTTGKVAVKISVEENSTLQNGSTVSLSFSTDTEDVAAAIVVPLAAVKMTGSGPVVFTINDGSLTAVPITLGAVTGENVTITEGVTLDTQIVTDARGLKDGQVVTVTTN